MQKSYGKTEAELETLVEGFAWALAEYPMYQTVKAIRKYILANNDIPAPSDIIKIIDRDRFEADRGHTVSIETLADYEAKGIPLLPEQIERLKQYRSNAK